MIDIASVKTACNLVKSLSNKQLESKIFDKIELLEKKVDTVLIRDLLAANAALDDIKAVGHASPETIAHIRKLYMGNTGLPLDQKTYGIENSKIVVASYLGLLQIGMIQGESEKMLCRYMLHMFATGEVVVFKELLNSFYRTNYSKMCAHYEAEAIQRKQNWKAERALIGRYKRLTAAAEVAAGITGPFICVDPMPTPGGKLLGAIMRYATAGESEECMRQIHYWIEEQRDQSIAETCARKSKEQLNQKDPFFLK